MHRYAALHISVSLMNFQLGINSRFNDLVLTYAPKLWIRDLTKGRSNHNTSLIAHSSSFVSSCQELVSQILVWVFILFFIGRAFFHILSEMNIMIQVILTIPTLIVSMLIFIELIIVRGEVFELVAKS